MSKRADITQPTTPTERLTTVPVIKERLAIDTVETVAGRVVVDKTVKQTQVDVPLPTVHTEYTENRILRNVEVAKMPVIRTEGNTTIIPVVREETVVSKRLVLVEEIHLTKQVRKEEKTVPVTLSEDVVTITRE